MSFRPCSDFKSYNGWTNYATWLWNIYNMDYVMELVTEDTTEYRDMTTDEMCEWLVDLTYELFFGGEPHKNSLHWDVYRHCWEEEIDYVQLAEHIQRDAF